MNFLSSEVAIYFLATFWPSMGYCYHAWADVPNYYLDMLNKLEKQVCKAGDSTLTTPLNPFFIIEL